MTSKDTCQMRALMSRPAREGRKALRRGDTYNATAQQCRDDVRRGFGERVTADKPAQDKAKP